jgi:protein gp37
MAERSAISWTDHTFNPWWGCTKVSPACDHCYAERDAKRHYPRHVLWGADADRRMFGDAHWAAPLRWDRSAAKAGVRRRVFCASMADVFDNHGPHLDRERARLFSLIAQTPNLDWLLLTKRIGNAHRMLDLTMDAIDRAQALGTTTVVRAPWPWPNVWLGATVVNQAEADRDVPKLLAVPARVRFLSIEPMLGPIDVRKYMWPVHPVWPAKYRSPQEAIAAGAEVQYKRQALVSKAWADHMLSWVIAGGESGPHARPAHPDWFRSLRDQCAAAGVPFHFKQWGEWWEVDSESRDEETGEHHVVDVPGIEADERFDRKTDCLVARDGRVFGTLDDLPDDLPARHMTRLGKKAAGRLLDSVEHNGFPKAAAC